MMTENPEVPLGLAVRAAIWSRDLARARHAAERRAAVPAGAFGPRRSFTPRQRSPRWKAAPPRLLPNSATRAPRGAARAELRSGRLTSSMRPSSRRRAGGPHVGSRGATAPRGAARAPYLERLDEALASAPEAPSRSGAQSSDRRDAERLGLIGSRSRPAGPGPVRRAYSSNASSIATNRVQSSSRSSPHASRARTRSRRLRSARRPSAPPGGSATSSGGDPRPRTRRSPPTPSPCSSDWRATRHSSPLRRRGS